MLLKCFGSNVNYTFTVNGPKHVKALTSPLTIKLLHLFSTETDHGILNIEECVFCLRVKYI